MAARKVSSSSAAATAVAVAVLATMLVVAATAQDCGVDAGQVKRACLSYCRNGGSSSPQDCCDALNGADVGCLCSNYWNKLRHTPFASCAQGIQRKCGLGGC